MTFDNLSSGRKIANYLDFKLVISFQQTNQRNFIAKQYFHYPQSCLKSLTQYQTNNKYLMQNSLQQSSQTKRNFQNQFISNTAGHISRRNSRLHSSKSSNNTNLVYAQRSRNNRITMSKEAPLDMHQKLQNYYRHPPIGSMGAQQQQQAQILRTQPVNGERGGGGSSYFYTKTHELTHDDYQNGTILQQSNERMHSSIRKRSAIDEGQVGNQIQNVKVFKTSSNILKTSQHQHLSSQLLHFQSNAKISQQNGANTINESSLTQTRKKNVVNKTSYHPLKTTGSSEKNVSKKSTQPSKQMVSVTGMPSFFSSGRTPSQYNNQKASEIKSASLFNNTLQSPTICDTMTSNKFKRPMQKYLSPEFDNRTQSKQHTALTGPSSRGDHQPGSKRTNIGGFKLSGKVIPQIAGGRHGLNQTMGSIANKPYHHRGSGEVSQQNQSKLNSPPLKVSFERILNNNIQTIERMKGKQINGQKKTSQIKKQMNIIVNNVQLNQQHQSRKNSDLTPDRRLFLNNNCKDRYTSPKINANGFMEPIQKMKQSVTLTTLGTQSYSHSLIQREPQFDIFKLSKDQKQNGYIMPKSTTDKDLSSSFQHKLSPTNQQMQETWLQNQQKSITEFKQPKHTGYSSPNNIININKEEQSFINGVQSRSSHLLTQLASRDETNRTMQNSIFPPKQSQYNQVMTTGNYKDKNNIDGGSDDSDEDELSIPQETNGVREQMERTIHLSDENNNDDTDEVDFEGEEKVPEVYIKLHENATAVPAEDSNHKVNYESSGCNIVSQDLDEQQNKKSMTNNKVFAADSMPMSSRCSTTLKMNDWDKVNGKKIDTEMIEFQKNEEHCQKLVEQESKYTSALNNAVQQIKFEQSRSNQVSILADQEASPDELKNKNLNADTLAKMTKMQLTQISGKEERVNKQNKELQKTVPQSTGSMQFRSEERDLAFTNNVVSEQTVFRASTQGYQSARVNDFLSINTPKNRSKGGSILQQDLLTVEETIREEMQTKDQLTVEETTMRKEVQGKEPLTVETGRAIGIGQLWHQTSRTNQSNASPPDKESNMNKDLNVVAIKPQQSQQQQVLRQKKSKNQLMVVQGAAATAERDNPQTLQRHSSNRSNVHKQGASVTTKNQQPKVQNSKLCQQAKKKQEKVATGTTTMTKSKSQRKHERTNKQVNSINNDSLRAATSRLSGISRLQGAASGTGSGNLKSQQKKQSAMLDQNAQTTTAAKNNTLRNQTPKNNRSTTNLKTPRIGYTTTRKRNEATAKGKNANIPTTHLNLLSEVQFESKRPSRADELSIRQQKSDMVKMQMDDQKLELRIFKSQQTQDEQQQDIKISLLSTPDDKPSPIRIQQQSSLVDNSAGLRLSRSGERLQEIIEEEYDSNKLRSNIRIQNLASPGNSGKRASSQQPTKRQSRNSDDLRKSLMALKTKDIHSNFYWDQIDALHKQIQNDGRSFSHDKYDSRLNKTAGHGFPSNQNKLLGFNYLPRTDLKLKYNRSFAERISRGFGLNLRNSDEFDAIEKASQDLYIKFVENHKRNQQCTLQYTTEDEPHVLSESLKKDHLTTNGHNLRLLNQSFLTSKSKPSSIGNPYNNNRILNTLSTEHKQEINTIIRPGEVDDYNQNQVASPLEKSPKITASLELSQLNSSKDFILSKSVEKKFKNFNYQQNPSGSAVGYSQGNAASSGVSGIMQQQVKNIYKEDSSRMRSFQNSSTTPVTIKRQQHSRKRSSLSDHDKHQRQQTQQKPTSENKYRALFKQTSFAYNKFNIEATNARILRVERGEGIGNSFSQQSNGSRPDGDETDGTNLHSEQGV